MPVYPIKSTKRAIFDKTVSCTNSTVIM